jgi:hypothetical protein
MLLNKSLFVLYDHQHQQLQHPPPPLKNMQQNHNAVLASIVKAVLTCQFEQTDAGADEAVEMAVAEVLGQVVALLPSLGLPETVDPRHAAITPETLAEIFHAVFVTRTSSALANSPALVLRLEDILLQMTQHVFRPGSPPNEATATPNRKVWLGRCQAVLEFWTHPLLHTPLVGGDGLDESTREDQRLYDATRVLCLRAVRTALQTGWAEASIATSYDMDDEEDDDEHYQSLISIIQDDLCLSLLMTGQAIWAYHDAHTNISPGFVSLEVLSEICATLTTLWNTLPLRTVLIAQFETIWTGFYTRALVLLRKRHPPTNSLSFNANLTFDAEVEIILESLVDVLCLHDHVRSIADGDGGALETMFAYYDCHLRRSDVAVGLMVELCRCCGGAVDPDGETLVLTPSTSFLARPPTCEDSVHSDTSDTATPPDTAVSSPMVQVDHVWRPVPPHLKELCAQALMGGMKCLFRDDKASAETLLERSRRKRSIMSRQLKDSFEEALSETIPNTNVAELSVSPSCTHVLRDVKTKKRLMRKAARIFNHKASRGIEFLLDAGLVADPVTPMSVATFLRNGIVVGLDKKAVGAYLGEAGKAPIAGKSPLSWERDWFHKDVLQSYCGLFRFEGQSLLDGLRMFLAAFRLPGEAQQIDRILQAFSDSCGQVCEESADGRLQLFSEDPKRASDAAYLLSFSIIMLNTDRHNTNIREDRKMSAADFVKNNTDYGRDITEKGKEFPSEFLEGIYHSINDEEIRTEGEGADGAMTVERWKDVLRGSTEEAEDEFLPSLHDAEDLTELVLEHVWKPIMSSIGAFWGMPRVADDEPLSPSDPGQNGMLGVQGARLGMDMALEMLHGVRKLGRIDIFRKIFSWICDYTGLIGEYSVDAVERTWSLTNSVEAQSAVVAAIRTALDAGEDLNGDGWKRLWSILFEMRDLKLLAYGGPSAKSSLLHESDPDILDESARRDWTISLVKGDMDFFNRPRKEKKSTMSSSVFGAFGRALFGADTENDDERSAQLDSPSRRAPVSSVHGKEDLVVWDDYAPSDDEEEPQSVEECDDLSSEMEGLSPGAEFENLLIRESLGMSRQLDLPVTGLERMDEARRHHVSPRARVRGRLTNACNFKALVSDSRFLNDAGIRVLLQALAELIAGMSRSTRLAEAPPLPPPSGGLERSSSSDSIATPVFLPTSGYLPISPASEAFAEVLICEIALKNRDRLKMLWKDVLQDHYLSSLTSILVNPVEGASTAVPQADPGLEKRVTGLLRISICAVQRDELSNEILSAWKYLLPISDEQRASSPLRVLDKHIGEGLWRTASSVDGLHSLNADGWEGLMSLLKWCAKCGGMSKPVISHGSQVSAPLPENDPAYQGYRTAHLILNTEDLDKRVPCSIVDALKALVEAGQNRAYPQLSIASLDLLHTLHEKKINSLQTESFSDENAALFWSGCWRETVAVMAEAAELSSDTNVRQHSLSMLTDLFLEKRKTAIPVAHVAGVLSEICVPLAGRCILRLQMGDDSIENSDALMIEFELCISLIFKPLRHHLNTGMSAISDGNLSSIWKSVLSVLEELLREDSPSLDSNEGQPSLPVNLKATMNQLVNEHLQNAISVLIAAGVLLSEGYSKASEDISFITWESVGRMGIPESAVVEWRQQALHES